MAKKIGIREWVRQNASTAKDYEKFVVEIQKRFHLNRKSARDAISKLRAVGQIPQGLFPPTIKSNISTSSKHVNKKSFRMSAIDLSEIAGEYDEEAKILSAIENFGQKLIKDNDLRVVLGVPIDRWKAVSNMEKFAENKREVKTKRFRGVYWGTKETIELLSRKMDIL